MAIELVGTNGDFVSLGVMNLPADLTAYSFCVTIQLKEAISPGRRILNVWGATANEQAFGIGGQGSQMVGFAMNTSTHQVRGRQSTSAPGTTGDLLRILCKTTRGATGAAGFEQWYNGVKDASVSWIADWTADFVKVPLLSTLNACTDFGGTVGAWGIYSEIAVWTEEVPDQAAIDYGAGGSPLDYPDGLIHYSSMATLPFTDEVGGNTVVINGGTVIPGTPNPPSGGGGGGGLPPGTSVMKPSLNMGLGL